MFYHLDWILVKRMPRLINSPLAGVTDIWETSVLFICNTKFTVNNRLIFLNFYWKTKASGWALIKRKRKQKDSGKHLFTKITKFLANLFQNWWKYLLFLLFKWALCFNGMLKPTLVYNRFSTKDWALGAYLNWVLNWARGAWSVIYRIQNFYIFRCMWQIQKIC